MRNLSRQGTYISRNIGKAIADFDLIEDGDRILVAVSGGKDSYVLLRLLNERLKWAPVDYTLIPVHIEDNFSCTGLRNRARLTKIFKTIKCGYHFRRITFARQDKKKMSCFWCSWNRRKALFEAADELKCNKIAMGHHKDDIIETFLLNLFFNGNISAMNVKQSLFKGKLHIIRPLAYAEEKDIEKYARELKFVKEPCRCPNSELSRRRMVKDLIKDLKVSSPHIKTNLFRAPSHIKEDYLMRPEKVTV